MQQPLERDRKYVAMTKVHECWRIRVELEQIQTNESQSITTGKVIKRLSTVCDPSGGTNWTASKK